MWRAGFAGLTAALVLAAPACAATPSVSTALSAGVTLSFVSSYQSPKDGVGPTVIGDGFGINPPTLYATPGSDVAITLDAPVDAVKASFGFSQLAVVPTGERTYKATLPADAALPSEFWIRLDYSTETTVGSSSWKVILDAVPAPPPSSPVVAAAPEPPATAVFAHLSGRRLAVVVACPFAARSGCAGTLRAAGKRMAFASLAPGTRRTLRATVSKRVAKQLRRARDVRVELGRVKARLPLR